MEYVNRMFDLVEETNAAFDPQGMPSGRVVVGTGPLLIDRRIGALLRECRYRYPQVCLSPQIVGPSRMEAAVLDGDIHLGLTVGPAPDTDLAPPPAGLTSQSLAPVELVPVGGPAFNDPQSRTAALRTAPVLVVDPECPSQAILPTALRERYGADPQVIETGSASGARALAESGCGIAMLPQSSVRPDSSLAVLPDLPRARLDVRAVWPEQSWMPPAVAAVLELARRVGDEKLATAA
ncbi:substrate-binding domain-containing protein [Streptomyces sp. NBC_00091]|uniref:substrate-binding domain-containing protein n=1 Tax=Streptomyces sp. NBC_00091 TaxID=2975648 RepID=UPI00225ADA0E|nr:substrate-binding domain-containing protein [Streptomyces sp. NBC_00091]MCX5380554.1 substrate-binding domain-containing protein [Streptomyces sp. NBC_00091]